MLGGRGIRTVGDRLHRGPSPGTGGGSGATKILQRMTDYLGSLKQFSVHTQNTLEDLLASGHRVDFDVSANVIVSR